jgi:hypothetical protein
MDLVSSTSLGGGFFVTRVILLSLLGGANERPAKFDSLSIREAYTPDQIPPMPDSGEQRMRLDSDESYSE